MLLSLLLALPLNAPSSQPPVASPAGQDAAGCQASWIQTFGPVASLDGPVFAMEVLDLGGGPALYVGGGFHGGGSPNLSGVVVSSQCDLDIAVGGGTSIPHSGGSGNTAFTHSETLACGDTLTHVVQAGYEQTTLTFTCSSCP